MFHIAISKELVMDNLKNDVAIIKFIQYDEQYSGCITRVVGYAKIRSLINLIDVLDLDANPRSSKVGTVTNDIQDSIENTPDIFPFKTKVYSWHPPNMSSLNAIVIVCTSRTDRLRVFWTAVTMLWL